MIEKLEYPVPQKSLLPSEEVRSRISALDFEPLRLKLNSGLPRSLHHHIEEAEKHYRMFLFLAGTTGEIIIPTGEIDEFWHTHILDTRKYAADCERVFGFFLDHFPYIGLRGEEDKAEFHRLGRRTEQLWEATYGEPYIKEDSFEGCG